jgi:hypothetical protein
MVTVIELRFLRFENLLTLGEPWLSDSRAKAFIKSVDVKHAGIGCLKREVILFYN